MTHIPSILYVSLGYYYFYYYDDDNNTTTTLEHPCQKNQDLGL